MKRTFFKIDYGPAFQSALLDRRTLVLPPALRAFHGRSILFMTDLHMSRMFPEAAMRRLLDQALPLEADIICLGGDFAENERGQALAATMLGALRPRIGAFAVLGNNDCEHLYHGGHRLTGELLRAGIVTLIDSEARIDLPGGARLRVAGLNSLREYTEPAAPFFADSGERDLRLLMAHYPQSIRMHLDNCLAPPHLALSGHTHGGQLRFLGLTPYSIGYERRRGSHLMPIEGWTDRLGFPTLISPGVGTSRLPFRLNAPPTIHLITLTCENKRAAAPDPAHP